MPAADNKLKQDVKDRIISETADGSKTLYMPSIDEHYHSVKGALTESMHIFIDCGLRHSAAQSPLILEIGFGTGLNAYLTLLEAEKEKRNISYTAIERYPLEHTAADKLGYCLLPEMDNKKLFDALHLSAWEEQVRMTEHFTLLKRQADFTDTDSWKDIKKYDIVYFDAFSPEKQPEMWSAQIFSQLYKNMNHNGILTTYCAKGCIRRMMQDAGFAVERLPGPPGGKREILRATKTTMTK